jgi:hypothetical protein
MAKNNNDKAGKNDVPKNAKEGRKVERDEKRVNKENERGGSYHDKLKRLLDEDDD